MTVTVELVSGGLDSFLASKFLKDPTFLFIDYGQSYISLEEKAVGNLYPNVQKIKVSGFPDMNHDDYYVPARNLMFATMALRFGTNICMAGVADEICADKSPAAFKDMTEILNRQARGNVRVFSPFWKHTKAEAVKKYLELGFSPDDLLKTVSCYDGKDNSCLDCQACFRRWVALKVNGINTERPTERIIREYGLRDLHVMSLKRIMTIFQAIESDGSVIHFTDLNDAIDGKKPDDTSAYNVLVTSSKFNQKIYELLVSTNTGYDSIIWEVEQESMK